MLQQLWPACAVQTSSQVHYLINQVTFVPLLCQAQGSVLLPPPPHLSPHMKLSKLLPALKTSLALCFPFFAIPKGLCPSWSICLVQHYFTYPNCHHHRHAAPEGINWEDLFVYPNFLISGLQTLPGMWRSSQAEKQSKFPTCNEVSDEKWLIFFIIFQHALKILLLPLDSNLHVPLVWPPLHWHRCLGCCEEKRLSTPGWHLEINNYSGPPLALVQKVIYWIPNNVISFDRLIKIKTIMSWMTSPQSSGSEWQK